MVISKMASFKHVKPDEYDVTCLSANLKSHAAFSTLYFIKTPKMGRQQGTCVPFLYYVTLPPVTSRAP